MKKPAEFDFLTKIHWKNAEFFTLWGTILEGVQWSESEGVSIKFLIWFFAAVKMQIISKICSTFLGVKSLFLAQNGYL